MAATQNNGGDVLARGGSRATFRQPNVSKEKYQEATEGFDLARFLKGDQPKESGKKEINRRK